MGPWTCESRTTWSIIGDPAGPVVVLAHGFGYDQNFWRLVAPVLARDHRVVLFDHVGAGRSDPSAWDPGRYASLHGHAEDVLDLCTGLDLHEVVFVGHSVSAMIGCCAGRQSLSRPAGN
ncbi:hypothetical protein ALI144C_30660 [Actinosynnema sp. ALI-1.44]|uniref:alpha/beta fold hydrolase n=1 Tax=Actinosynnema sp. ALI-1.44 TaxID=1933779 RepID=UPI00097C8C29|nr:alpha/beta fold hydrolase [Actinosynnema sp. ALI-1.44]ONI77801.1 hypothetical protein ALI144C_30660 [Actinosynnema sp. ALI-1.44]